MKSTATSSFTFESFAGSSGHSQGKCTATEWGCVKTRKAGFAGNRRAGNGFGHSCARYFYRRLSAGSFVDEDKGVCGAVHAGGGVHSKNSACGAEFDNAEMAVER